MVGYPIFLRSQPYFLNNFKKSIGATFSCLFKKNLKFLKYFKKYLIVNKLTNLVEKSGIGHKKSHRAGVGVAYQ